MADQPRELSKQTLSQQTACFPSPSAWRCLADTLQSGRLDRGGTV